MGANLDLVVFELELVGAQVLEVGDEQAHFVEPGVELVTSELAVHSPVGGGPLVGS